MLHRLCSIDYARIDKKPYKIRDEATRNNIDNRNYDDCRISVKCPDDQFALFSVNGAVDTKAYHLSIGFNIDYMEQFWNYWDFRVESDDDVYFNAHLESVKN